jgi:cytoplasmic tRNA 2-thiolation protein 2
MNPPASIQELTETFVTDLQENFPATVSTIFRTGDKLSVGSGMPEDEGCALCQVCGVQLIVQCWQHTFVCK